MAYMSQDHKKQIHEKLKKTIPMTWRWSLAVEHLSTIILTIRSADVDLIAEICKEDERYQQGADKYNQRKQIKESQHCTVNEYFIEQYFKDHLVLFKEILGALNDGNWNRSDLSSDYFDVGHYVAIHIGRWDKPFICTKNELITA